MKFLRTAPTRRLLAMIAGLVIAVAAGAAIAVAATSSGPVPKREPLATALHRALTAPGVTQISARISFTNNLISSADFTGETADPLLQGTPTGRLWMSKDALRLELQSDNGDAEVLVRDGSFWISDPASNTVYEGTLPKDSSSSSTKSAGKEGPPSIAQLQKEITRLMGRVDLAGAATSDPEDIAGRPAYSVRISPKHSGGELGALQLGWDAVKGIPLDVAVYARGNSTPALELKVTDISFSSSPSDFDITPPAGDKVVKVDTASTAGAANALKKGRATAKAQVSGAAAVARHLSFPLTAPRSVVGLPRHGVTLMNWGGSPAALLTYGKDLGGIAVIEQKAPAGSGASANSAPGGNLSLPTVSINGATGQELATELGTLLRFTSNGVAYTVVGSVTPYAAEAAARALIG
jgi:outer membrane lipoprotein-sorting protein